MTNDTVASRPTDFLRAVQRTAATFEGVGRAGASRGGTRRVGHPPSCAPRADEISPPPWYSPPLRTSDHSLGCPVLPGCVHQPGHPGARPRLLFRPNSLPLPPSPSPCAARVGAQRPPPLSPSPPPAPTQARQSQQGPPRWWSWLSQAARANLWVWAWAMGGQWVGKRWGTGACG